MSDVGRTLAHVSCTATNPGMRPRTPGWSRRPPLFGQVRPAWTVVVHPAGFSQLSRPIGRTARNTVLARISRSCEEPHHWQAPVTVVSSRRVIGSGGAVAYRPELTSAW